MAEQEGVNLSVSGTRLASPTEKGQDADPHIRIVNHQVGLLFPLCKLKATLLFAANHNISPNVAVPIHNHDRWQKNEWGFRLPLCAYIG